jgi:hypothetical protein
LRQYYERPPTASETLCTLFEFAIGLSLVNVLVIGILSYRYQVDAKVINVTEATLLFGFFGLLLIFSKLSSSSVDGSPPTIVPLFLALGAGVGGGIGLGFALGLLELFSFIELLVGPLRGAINNVIAAGLFTALIGLAGGSAWHFSAERRNGKLGVCLQPWESSFLRSSGTASFRSRPAQSAFRENRGSKGPSGAVW